MCPTLTLYSKGSSMFQRFFRNRAVQLQFVEPQFQPKHQAGDEGETGTTKDPFEGPNVAAAYSAVAKDLIGYTAFTVGGVWAGCKIVERICR